MKPRRYLKQTEVREILRRYQDSQDSTARIATDFGVDPSYPGLLARRNGIALRKPNRFSKRRLVPRGEQG